MRSENKRIRFGRTTNALKRAGRFLGAAVLAAGLMLGSGKALAKEKKPKPAVAAVQEKKAEKGKAGLGLTLGAGHEFASKQPRASAVIDASIQLPLQSSLYAAFGLNIPLRENEQKVGVEELDIYLNTQLSERIGLFAGGYISKHLWVDKLSPEGGVNVSLPAGLSAAASYVYLVGLEKPHLILAKIGRDFISGRLSVVTKWAYTVDSSGSGRVGIYVSPKANLPKIGIDTIVIFNKKEVMFADAALSARWSF